MSPPIILNIEVYDGAGNCINTYDDVSESQIADIVKHNVGFGRTITVSCRSAWARNYTRTH